MVINLIAIGRRMPDWVQMGYNEYAKRLTSDLTLKLLEIPLQKRRSEKDVARAMKIEGEGMLSAMTKESYSIALDIEGEQWDTHQLARQLQGWQQKAQPINLLIGGPEGLAAPCLERANQRWSLSRLTFPHPLVRVIVAEQLYRAFSILTHHPYHRN